MGVFFYRPRYLLPTTFQSGLLAPDARHLARSLIGNLEFETSTRVIPWTFEKHPPKIGPQKKGNKEYKYFFPNFVWTLGYVFPKKLGLDEGITSWDLKIRIPRRKLRI